MGTRRSRMRRKSSGKRVMLTGRDLAIFAALARYRYLRSTYLHAFAGGASQTRFKERLGDLFHEGYLDRPEAQWRFADARTAPVIYELGLGAKALLSAHSLVTDERRVLLGTGMHRQFLHSLMICEVLASIELAVQSAPETAFVPLPTILTKAPVSIHRAKHPLRLIVGANPGAFVVPDALFGLRYDSGGKNAYRFFAVEADRGTMPIVRTRTGQTSLLAKLTTYQHAIATQAHKAQLGIPNLLVLTITTSEARLRAIIRQLDGRTGDAANFLFKSFSCDDLLRPTNHLLFEPWVRASHPLFRIDK